MTAQKPTLRDVFGAFVFYFLAQFLIAPLAFQLIYRLMSGKWEGAFEWIQTPHIRPWWNFLMIVFVALTMGLYVFVVERRVLSSIWGSFKSSSFSILKAFGYWAVAYFAVLLANNVVHFLMEKWMDFPAIDQTAVEQVRSAFSQPVLYVLTSLSIITIVPFVEEVLFRGYLQQWLKNYFSVRLSILMSAFIFSLFHFSSDQGWTNIEIIASLFTFSLFLGFVRERYGSLNASILLHGIFNGMSVLFLTIQELLP